MSPPFKVYFGQDILPIAQSDSWLSIPFQNKTNQQTWNNRDTFDLFLKEHEKYIQISSLNDCDFAASPLNWIHNEINPEILKLHAHTHKHNKKLLINYPNDHEVPVDLPNTLILKPALQASTRRPNDVLLPTFVKDLPNLYSNGELLLGKKNTKPTVNFCGNALYPSKQPGIANIFKRLYNAPRFHLMGMVKLEQVLRKIGIRLTTQYPAKIRTQSLLPCRRDNRIITNFIIRDAFRNGIQLSNTPEDTLLIQDSERTYTNNTLEADFIPCPRGAGNFSFRFYETLACARVPIFINTDCVLPFENHINWKDYCIWVEEKDIHTIPQRVIDFFHNTSHQDFIQFQTKCRQIWENYLTPTGFLENLHLILQK